MVNPLTPRTAIDANIVAAAIQGAIQALAPALELGDQFDDVPDEDAALENDEDYEIDEDEESVDSRYDDEDPEIGLSQMQTEICLMNQAIETSGLELSEILPAIAWLTTHSGRLVPCLNCLSEGWKENEDGEPEGTGRCSKHANHDNEDYLPELEQEVFPNYLEILGEA